MKLTSKKYCYVCLKICKASHNENFKRWWKWKRWLFMLPFVWSGSQTISLSVLVLYDSSVTHEVQKVPCSLYCSQQTRQFLTKLNHSVVLCWLPVLHSSLCILVVCTYGQVKWAYVLLECFLYLEIEIVQHSQQQNSQRAHGVVAPRCCSVALLVGDLSIDSCSGGVCQQFKKHPHDGLQRVLHDNFECNT